MRRLLGIVRRRLGAARRPLILMYHRIAEPRVDPWSLAVRPHKFEQHLSIIRRSRCVLSMPELVQRLEHRTLPASAVAVTFDDGYADNADEAAPRLAAAGVPATLFVTTGAVGQRTEYWWDELARLVLLHDGGVDHEVLIDGQRCRVSFASSPATEGWRAWATPPGPREDAYLRLWRELRDVSVPVRESVMNDLRAIFSAPEINRRDLPMSAAELAALAGGGTFELGAHTVTHPALPMLTAEDRRREILQSKNACERIAGRSIHGFAYPHGAVNDDSRAAVEESGLSWACSTQPSALARRGYDRYSLPRIWVHDWDGEAFKRALEEACA